MFKPRIVKDVLEHINNKLSPVTIECLQLFFFKKSCNITNRILIVHEFQHRGICNIIFDLEKYLKFIDNLHKRLLIYSIRSLRLLRWNYLTAHSVHNNKFFLFKFFLNYNLLDLLQDTGYTRLTRFKAFFLAFLLLLKFLF